MARAMLGVLALCLTASLAAGQEPIAELKVTPQMSVFENAIWNKPIVIKSQEQAARHFGKDALDVIARKVDFSKQIVLVFAWQGSGGDKLSYEILESFPEQVPFYLSRGRTRDLRQHSRTFVLRANVKWSVAAPR